MLLNGDGKLRTGDYIFNNVVCSGSHYSDVEEYQFYDEDHTNEPDWQFSTDLPYLGPSVVTV